MFPLVSQTSQPENAAHTKDGPESTLNTLKTRQKGIGKTKAKNI